MSFDLFVTVGSVWAVGLVLALALRRIKERQEDLIVKVERLNNKYEQIGKEMGRMERDLCFILRELERGRRRWQSSSTR